MRKSAAPSRLSQPLDYLSQNINPRKTSECKPTSHSPPSLQIPVIPKHTDLPLDFKRYMYFEAVYAKASTKKHKKWEGDGFVEVDGRTMKLITEDLKVIASTSSHKLAFLNDIDTGSIVHIGSYEAELISRIEKPQLNSANSKSKEVTKTSFASEEYPTNKATTKSSICLPKPSAISTHDVSNDSLNPLIMPKPPADCIWFQNPDSLPIVDVILESKFASRLQSHQREGVIFLYKCLMGFQPYVAVNESISRNVYGCILADEMGLGKTVQAIATIWLLIKQGPYGGRPVIRRCLIVTPGTLVQNWSKEFTKWLGRERLPIYCVDQTHSIKNYLTTKNPPQIILMSYEMFLQHSSEVYTISDLDMVVCDEGHRLKNSNINTTMTLCQLRASRRLLLTGTPLQNHLNELWSLANFCVPGRLTSSLEEFCRQFVIPLLNSRKSQYRKSTDTTHKICHDDVDDDDNDDFWNPPIDDYNDIDDLESPSAKLIRLLNSFFLRRTCEVIAPKLTDKTEHIVFCRPSKLQTDLELMLTQWMSREFNIRRDESVNLEEEEEDEDFDEAIEDTFTFSSSLSSKRHNFILSIITAFRKLHNHPYLLERYLVQSNSAQNHADSRLPSKLTADLLELLNSSYSTTKDVCHKNLNDFVELSGKFSILYIMLKRLFINNSSLSSSINQSQLHKRPRLNKNNLSNNNNNVHVKDRLILVSNFTQTLDLLEKLCNLVTGTSCLRLDGQTTNKQRGEIVQRINDPKSNDCILLLSSRAGGTGLNLIGANYLILFDMDWNPANDAQAMARIWRPGQSRPVRLYRLVTAGGMEERIFQRQAAKLALTSQTLVNTSMHNGNIFNFLDKSLIKTMESLPVMN
ncbi:unnamed protein product [Heterobilharzia americana]|nr:unnamed protein product [Heterobilharzia americana]